MITPQNVIQSIDQKPVPAPTPQAANVLPTGEPQTVIARTMVTAAPMITARHADIRITGSSISSRTIGTSATSVLPSVECAGLSDWTNEDPLTAETRKTGVACTIGLRLPQPDWYTVSRSSSVHD